MASYEILGGASLGEWAEWQLSRWPGQQAILLRQVRVSGARCRAYYVPCAKRAAVRAGLAAATEGGPLEADSIMGAVIRAEGLRPAPRHEGITR